MSVSQRAHPSAPSPFLGAQDRLGPGTASGITSNNNTGGIACRYWRNNPTISPNMRGVGARSRRGASIIGTMIQTSSGLGRSNGDSGRLCSIVLNTFRWLSVWTNSSWNLPRPYRTWSAQLDSTTATRRPCTITAGKNGGGGGGGLVKVLMGTGVTVRARAMLYNAVVHTVFLYGSKRWMVTEEILKVMKGFHHWVARRITGKTAWPTVDTE